MAFKRKRTRFYAKTEQEINHIRHILNLSKKSCKLITITGKKNTEKKMIFKAFNKDRNFIFLLCSEKEEKILVEEFIREIEKRLKIEIEGEFTTVKSVFEFLFEYSHQNHIIVAIGECQNLYNINPSVFLELQKLWEKNREKSKMLLVFSAPVDKLVNKLRQKNDMPFFIRKGLLFLNY